MKRLLLVTFVVLFVATQARGQASPIPLRDGQQLTLTGRLTMEPAGRLQFVTVKTTPAYVPMFTGEGGGKDRPGEVLHEIGLAGYADYATLYAHRGQQVTVSGRLATDQATPYFWHGTRLQLRSIRSADGTDLLDPRASSNEAIAVDMGTYQAQAVLPADPAAPWIYRANDRPEREGRFLTCSSNGGGDVVNCACAKGFHPVAGQSVAAGRQAAARLFGNEAQFQANDDRHAIELAVSCSR